MSPSRKTRNTNSNGYRSTLEDDDIFMEFFNPAIDNPRFRELFLLISDLEHIRWERFAKCKESKGSSIEQISRAAHDYDKKLMMRAHSLYSSCNDYKRTSNKESEWMLVLEPLVFHRFDREVEEQARCHHWYGIDRHFYNADMQQLCMPPSP
jgi:hypothetical protein